MPIDVLMPQLSPTMTEGRLANWLVKAGDTVAAGDIIAEVETDKATMEVESTEDGIIHSIIGKTGTDILVGTPIAILKEKGETVAADYKPKSKAIVVEEKVAETSPVSSLRESEATAAIPAPAPAMAAPVAAPTPVISNVSAGRTKASPLAKRLAAKLGINLAAVQGTGPNGRITEQDVQAAQGGAKSIIRQVDGSIPLTPMRKAIGEKMVQTKQWVPHFYLTADVDMDSLLEIREQINATAQMAEDGRPAFKVSVNDMIIKACALALRDKPEANAAWGNGATVQFGNVDISVAVSIEGGLITPIVQNADLKPLITISQEVKSLAKAARSGKLKPEQYTGGGFSISNLGMYGIKEFSAIINAPQAAILACGAAQMRPVAGDDGELYAANIMTMTMSVDHRVIDGALGAELLARVKHYLENPVAMIL